MTRIAIAASAILAISAPAFAAMPEAQSVEVSTSGLDLNSPADRARLKARVGRAADRVCGLNDTRGVVAQRAFLTCRTAALRNTLGQ